MFNIGSFLERFKKLDTERGLEKGTVTQILFQEANLSIDPKEIRIRNGVVEMLRASSALKNQIFMKKATLLRAFKEKMGESAPYDIR